MTRVSATEQTRRRLAAQVRRIAGALPTTGYGNRSAEVADLSALARWLDRDKSVSEILAEEWPKSADPVLKEIAELIE